MKSFKDFLRESSSYVSEALNDGEIIVSNKTQLRKLIDDFSLSLDKITLAKNLKDISGAFKNSTRKDFSGLETWDVSHVTNMRSMFVKCKNFTGKEIEKWDVKNVKDFSGMFGNCSDFNANLSRWNVSNAEEMISMFSGCDNFTGKGLEKWNVSNVVQMNHMFDSCKKFTGKSVEKWNLDSLKEMLEIDIKRIFEGSGAENNIPKSFMELIKKAEERAKENEREKEKKLADAFKKKFGVDYSKAPRKAQELWKGYDRFAAYIDDGRQYREAMKNNEWISNEIEKLLKK